MFSLRRDFQDTKKTVQCPHMWYGDYNKERVRVVELQVSVLPLLTILLSCSNRDSSKRDLNLRRLNDR